MEDVVGPHMVGVQLKTPGLRMGLRWQYFNSIGSSRLQAGKVTQMQWRTTGPAKKNDNANPVGFHFGRFYMRLSIKFEGVFVADWFGP